MSIKYHANKYINMISNNEIYDPNAEIIFHEI